jgi:hypothetical protein
MRQSVHGSIYRPGDTDSLGRSERSSHVVALLAIISSLFAFSIEQTIPSPAEGEF